MALHLLPQPLSESDRCIEHGTRENEKKLLSTVATHTVYFAGFPLQKLREPLEHGVPGLMAVIVVYTLELVDVAHHQRDGLVEPHRVLPHLVQTLVQGASVLDLGQSIGERHPCQLVIQHR